MSLIPILLLTIIFFAGAMLIMAVGLFFNRPCLRGSCGGPGIFDRDGDPVTCGTCPRRKELEAEAAERRSRGPLPTIQ
jgi:hypothetical protein